MKNLFCCLIIVAVFFGTAVYAQSDVEMKAQFFSLRAAASDATVEISGRVKRSNNRPAAFAAVIVWSGTVEVARGRTNSFGYYRIRNVPGGQTYTIWVSAKNMNFYPRSLYLSDNVANFDFEAMIN